MLSLVEHDFYNLGPRLDTMQPCTSSKNANGVANNVDADQTVPLGAV